MISKSSLVGLLGLVVGGLTGCGSSMPMTTIETDIKTDIEQQGRRLTLQEVRCPKDVIPQAGGYFRCVGELEPEGTFTINVMQDDARGNVTWDVPNSRVLLNLARVEADIQQGLSKAFSQRALIDCGSDLYRVNQPGDRFECVIVGGLTVGSEAFSSVLVTVDTDGNLNWQELHQPHRTATVAGTPPAAAQTTAQAVPSGQSSVSTTANPPSAPEPVKATTVTGPDGQKAERTYVPGDDD